MIQGFSGLPGNTSSILALLIWLCSAPVQADYAQGLFAYHHYDYKAARLQFLSAALNGHPDAQFYLGEIHEGGIGVPIDYKKAFDWYRRAADLGHAVAQSRLGAMCMLGRGVNRDPVRAFSWYLKSAENAYPLAQFEAGVLYAKGEGTAVNAVEAYKWLTIAASYGDPDAMATRVRVSTAMSPQAISIARRMAKEWEDARETLTAKP